MQNNISDKHIHDGHRERMRAKLLSHGQRIFDTYELLEMLLYYTVPFKDTNPISKRLLSKFGSLDGVFCAEEDELTTVSGIGEKTAHMIKTVAEISEVIGCEVTPKMKSVFADYHTAGAFFVECFHDVTEKKVIAVYLDNNLDLISAEEITGGIDFASAAIRPKLFMDGAIRNRASVMITAHNHPFGIPYPSEGDRATHEMLVTALERIRVSVVEHFVIADDKYLGIGKSFVKNFAQNPYLEGFIKEARAVKTAQSVSAEVLEKLRNCYNEADMGLFSDIISYVSKAGSEDSLKLLKRFRTIEAVLSASSDELMNYVNPKTVIYLKLLAYLNSRRITDKFAFDKKYSEKEIADFLKALYIGVSDETIYVLCLDSKMRFLAVERVGEGTVNASEVLPRKILESALKHPSKNIIIAHNHPGGRAEASGEDYFFTSNISDILRNSGIQLVSHYIVAGQKCVALRCESIEVKSF